MCARDIFICVHCIILFFEGCVFVLTVSILLAYRVREKSFSQRIHLQQL